VLQDQQFGRAGGGRVRGIPPGAPAYTLGRDNVQVQQWVLYDVTIPVCLCLACFASCALRGACCAIPQAMCMHDVLHTRLAGNIQAQACCCGEPVFTSVGFVALRLQTAHATIKEPALGCRGHKREALIPLQDAHTLMPLQKHPPICKHTNEAAKNQTCTRVFAPRRCPSTCATLARPCAACLGMRRCLH